MSVVYKENGFIAVYVSALSTADYKIQNLDAHITLFRSLWGCKKVLWERLGKCIAGALAQEVASMRKSRNRNRFQGVFRLSECDMSEDYGICDIMAASPLANTLFRVVGQGGKLWHWKPWEKKQSFHMSMGMMTFPEIIPF